ncbi:recombination protein RecR [Candidatus Collierbacteria bacterium RIFCSPHIGHO2_02_FULL_49_10]|uniref:Recombination protein RecR n=1 Tax=Candidatus Collierbacteria bacterium RIFCSPHIGHO2_02_FULL_49_10 TaxID=1817723 RepID=A0A1F5EUG6_9BACT|nr:MAG: recombination protein RecR [Candidatus Collierbacteria bacterium RIFCSPHIGHO2_02_FULL_49_10]
MRSLKPVQKVIDAFESLPGIGPKSAARLAYYLLHVPQERLEKFAASLSRLRLDTKECRGCFNIGESELCPVCEDAHRDRSIICVVEQPLDLLAFERADGYPGVYHVLGGALSPLTNIGPDELHISELLDRLKGSGVKELILATNPSMEGEATAMYITHQISGMRERGVASADLKVTRIGRGLPTGAEVEYADSLTLSRALEGRREI